MRGGSKLRCVMGLARVGWGAGAGSRVGWHAGWIMHGGRLGHGRVNLRWVGSLEREEFKRSGRR